MRYYQRGLTLLEMMLVVSLLSIAAMLSFWERQATFEQAQARVVGGLLYQYNNAVRSNLAQNSAIAVGTRTGSAWLKNTTCGGTLAPGKEYLPCDFPAANSANPIKFGSLTLTTVITATGAAPSRKLTATTTTSAFTLYKGSTATPRSDLSGMAAISAAAALGAGYSTSVTGSVPFTAITDASYRSNPTDAKITMIARNVGSGDIWLRTDGGNAMHANLRFDDTNALNRQIIGASRLQNLAGQILYLGSPSGVAPVSGAGVVVDTNAEIIGNLRVRNSLVVDNSATVSGNITATGSVTANGNLAAGNSISAGQSITAGANIGATNNITAGGAALAQIFYDSNNTGYYVDPNNTSNLLNLQTANIHNLGSVTSEGRVTTGEYLELGGVAAEGTGCAPAGLMGRTAAGKLLSCQSGLWAANGIQGNYVPMGTYIGSVTLNSGSKAQVVMARGGNAQSCGGSDGTNRYYLQAIIGGAEVAVTVDNNNEYYKTGTITFGVPANTNYTINSTPYACGLGTFQVYAFNL